MKLMKFAKLLSLCALVMLMVVPAVAQDSVMFNYQGRVKVQGKDFTGTGLFKFAILSPDKRSSLWSNDSTSNAGSEPTTGLEIEVTNGVFNVLMGSSGLMDEINSTIFQSKAPLKLRTWFSDGTHGFQELRPDHNLINVNLITSETGLNDFTIYVNGDTGDDSNSGLKPKKAKKTIQAAVNIVPSRVLADVTIEISEGIYPEAVQLFGISCKPGKHLRIQGDKNWSPVNGGQPNVVITAINGDEHNDVCLQAVQCSGIEVDGLTVTGAGRSGIRMEDGQYGVSDCVAKDNQGDGFSFVNQMNGQGINLTSKDNGGHGVAIGVSTRCNLTAPVLTGNTLYGLYVGDNSACGIRQTATITDNDDNGIHCIAFSAVACELDYSNGHITGNKGYGITVGWNSYLHNFNGKNTINNNAKGSYYTFNGGQLNY